MTPRRYLLRRLALVAALVVLLGVLVVTVPEGGVATLLWLAGVLCLALVVGVVAFRMFVASYPPTAHDNPPKDDDLRSADARERERERERE